LSKLPYILIAIAVGGVLTLQPGLNADAARRIGSPLGAVFVIGGLWLAPILGASVLFAAVVAGQMIGATIADQFGVGGYQAHAFDPWRIVAIALVLAGVWLFQRAA
jgi:uncharacterized membrane protein YdcZ (DUF606 family)